ncbi:hypothetical protein ACMZ52_27350, partial [Klebsiella pneumoniae]
PYVMLPSARYPVIRFCRAPEDCAAIGQTMSAPAHLLAPLVGAIVTPLVLIAGLACLSPGAALMLLAACALLVLVLRGKCRSLPSFPIGTPAILVTESMVWY